jgi:predicted DCC family thiol-disulfide oxidoreductase YuxK
MNTSENDKAIILFDGVCNFCNSSVNFVINHDSKNHFMFAALQSSKGRELMEKVGANSTTLDTLVLIENNKVFCKSSAALRIARRMNKLYPLLYIGMIVPKFIRDNIYDYFAKRRYKWFGKQETCMIPSEETMNRFIS